MTFSKSSLWSLVPLVLGAIVFGLVTGGTILRPHYIDWLMVGDASQHWVGWQFFRSSPLLQWPLGANPRYGMELGSSIVFTDSIPLMAFIFKFLNPLLPEHFQYFGIWLLVCFSLQTYFAWKLLSLFSDNKLLLAIGSLFFAIAPVCLWRLHGHYALFGQWVLIAALYLYCSKSFSLGRWAGLLFVVSLIHAYLLVMVLALVCMDLVQRLWLRQVGFMRTLVHGVALLALVGLTMWAAGYFMLGSEVISGGFGFFRMNLLSLIDPEGVWSQLLPDHEGKLGDYEGFNFLGSGIIGLGLVALFLLVKNIKTACRPQTLIPLLTLSILLFVYAISNHIAWATKEVFWYDLPDFAVRLTDTFRASGRFFWPAYYAIYLAVFCLLFKFLKQRVAIALCGVMLVAQVVDMNYAWQYLRFRFMHAPSWHSPMKSELWGDIAKRYKHIIMVLPRNAPPGWLPLAQFAGTHGMSTSAGYFARMNPATSDLLRDQLIGAITDQKLDPDSLYVFENDYLWKLAAVRLSPNDVQGRLDGVRIVAPNLKSCTTCKLGDVEAIEDVYLPHYNSGTLSFAEGGDGVKYLKSGWAPPKSEGAWSIDDTATLSIDLPVPPGRPLELQIDALGYVSERHPVQEVEVTVDGMLVTTLRYDLSAPDGSRTVRIPAQLHLGEHGPIAVSFKFKNAVAPAQVGSSEDLRNLGFSLQSLELRSLR